MTMGYYRANRLQICYNRPIGGPRDRNWLLHWPVSRSCEEALDVGIRLMVMVTAA